MAVIPRKTWVRNLVYLYNYIWFVVIYLWTDHLSKTESIEIYRLHLEIILPSCIILYGTIGIFDLYAWYSGIDGVFYQPMDPSEPEMINPYKKVPVEDPYEDDLEIQKSKRELKIIFFVFATLLILFNWTPPEGL
jgi:hypothetical protein